MDKTKAIARGLRINNDVNCGHDSYMRNDKSTTKKNNDLLHNT